jgi:hypothetical protein
MSEEMQMENDGADMDVVETPKPGFVRQKVDAVSTHNASRSALSFECDRVITVTAL